MSKAETSDTMATLIKLQEVDRKLAHMASMKEIEPKRLAQAEAAVRAREGDLAALDEEHMKSESAVDRKELDIRTRREKIDKLKGQMLKASNNREYQAFMKELSLEEMEKGRREDELLEMMLEIDAFSEKEGAARQAIEEAKGRFDKVKAEVDEALAEILAHENEVKQERAEVAARLDAATLKLYEGLFKSRGGEAVVPATYESGTGGNEGRYLCRGCFMPLTHQMVNLLLIGETIETCKSCRRILYVDDSSSEDE